MKRFKTQQIYFVLMVFVLGVLLIAGCSSSDEVALLTGPIDSVRPGECHESGPKVTAANPGNGAINVPVNATIAITFDEAMDPTRLVVNNAGNPEVLTITLYHDILTNVQGTVTYDALTKVATFTPSDDLIHDKEYKVIITKYAENEGGTSLGCSYEWYFRTVTAP
jgi:predicted component of type VI protein secretion system